MNQPNAKSSLLPSIIDRLIEPRGEEITDTRTRGQTVRELEESVRRDLQDLLNTRRSATEGFPEDTELSRSLLTFGLPELTSFDPTVPDQRRTLQNIIETTICKFEPRLMDVHVKSISADAASGRDFESLEPLTLNLLVCLRPTLTYPEAHRLRRHPIQSRRPRRMRQ